MSENEVDSLCKVTVVGLGIKAEKDVSLPVAMQIMQAMFGGAQNAVFAPVLSASEQSRSSDPLSPSRTQRLSIREFLEEIGSRSFHAKVAAVGRYMRDHEGQQDFSREEVKVRFRSAGEAMPGNFPRDFQKAIQSGWIAEDPQSRGRFYVTRRGDEAIDQRFEGASAAAIRPRRRRRSNAQDSNVNSGGDE